MRSAGGAPSPDVGAEDFVAWYEVAWPRVLRAVVLFAGDPDDAADIAAEACAKAFARWDGPDRPADPMTWVVVVALNLAKKQWRRAALGRPERVWDGKRSVGLGEVDIDLWRAVQQLPPRAREAVALRYGFDLTEQGVADAMGVSAGTAAATLHGARRKLRDLLAMEATMGERDDLDADLVELAGRLDLPVRPPPDALNGRSTARPWMARVLAVAAVVVVLAGVALALRPSTDEERLDVGGGSAGDAQPDLEFEGELLNASWLDNGFSVVQEPPPSYGGIGASASYVAYRYLPPADELAFDKIEDILDLTMEQGFVIDGGVGCYTSDLRDTELLDCGFGASRYVGGSRVEDVNLQYTVSSAGSSFTSVIRVSVWVWPEGVIVEQPPAEEGSSTSVPVVPRDLASFPTAEPPRMPEVGDAIESDDLDVDVPVVDGLDAISPVLKPPGCRGYIVLFDSDETPMQIIDRYERALPSSLDAVRRSFPLGDTESLQANPGQSTLTITATVNGARTHVVLDLCAG